MWTLDLADGLIAVTLNFLSEDVYVSYIIFLIVFRYIVGFQPYWTLDLADFE